MARARPAGQDHFDHGNAAALARDDTRPCGRQAGAQLGASRDVILRAYYGARTLDEVAREFDLPLKMAGSEFQQRVWRELTKIPFGKTSSYGQLAKRIGNPNGSRAVGLANGRNPIAIIVPCHRVIGADGSLTGFGGGIDRKQWLLTREGQPGTRALALGDVVNSGAAA